MWIARDEIGALWLFQEKPFRKGNIWVSVDGYCQALEDDDWFPEVSWEDEKPRELVLKPINEK